MSQAIQNQPPPQMQPNVSQSQQLPIPTAVPQQLSQLPTQIGVPPNMDNADAKTPPMHQGL